MDVLACGDVYEPTASRFTLFVLELTDPTPEQGDVQLPAARATMNEDLSISVSSWADITAWRDRYAAEARAGVYNDFLLYLVLFCAARGNLVETPMYPGVKLEWSPRRAL